jgi:hypothetical protein
LFSGSSPQGAAAFAHADDGASSGDMDSACRG